MTVVLVVVRFYARGSGEEDLMYYWIALAAVVVVVIFLSGIRVVRPTTRGLVERLGKYRRFANPGFNWVAPVIDRLFKINITEVMVNAEPQEIITSDKLNASVDAQVYFRVKSDEENVKNSQYAVQNYKYQIVNLARTTLRNIIGTMTLKSANSERGMINSELQKTLRNETGHWGIDIVRTELKEIDPPEDVQATMNKVVKAENEKVAAIDFATATETMADGARRAEIKKAEGVRQAKILEAEGEAQAIKLVNEAADKYFVGNAQLLEKAHCGGGGAFRKCQDRHSRQHGARERHRGNGRDPAVENRSATGQAVTHTTSHKGAACVREDPGTTGWIQASGKDPAARRRSCPQILTRSQVVLLQVVEPIPVTMKLDSVPLSISWR